MQVLSARTINPQRFPCGFAADARIALKGQDVITQGAALGMRALRVGSSVIARSWPSKYVALSGLANTSATIPRAAPWAVIACPFRAIGETFSSIAELLRNAR